MQHRARSTGATLGRIFLAVVLLVPLSGVGALAGGYPNTEQYGRPADPNAAWHRRCMEVKEQSPPAADAAAPAAEKDCDAQDLYYETRGSGEADSRDWREVRACAQATGDMGVLMMLYANGLGVKRDLRLALRYACSLGGAPAELEGRVVHLAKLMDSSAETRDAEAFDLCDDITSGYMQGVCTAISSKQAESRREDRFGEIEKKWTTAQRPAWNRLMKAVDAFAAARGDHETDMMGTARTALAIEAQDAELDLCLKDIERFEMGELPRFAPEQLAELDGKLNATYRAIQRAKTDGAANRLGYSSITKADVHAAQKVWLKYRDAWVAFARVRYPSVASHAWLALFTQRRLAQLTELLEMAESI